MAKNNSWIAVLIALVSVVALIVAIVALGKVSTTGEAIKFRNDKVSLINANSCNADDRCETNTLFSNSITSKILKANGSLWIGTNEGKITLEPDTSFVEIIGGLVVDEKARINSLNLDNMNNTNVILYPVAYVCVDANGDLFRKTSPCI